MAERIRWGIIGAGKIAETFAAGVAASTSGDILAIGSRAAETAGHFGKAFDIPRRYASYEAVLADQDIDAVYISTPHPYHAPWAIRAAEAGKHILCEKPLGINHAEAMAVVEAAMRHDVFLMEGYMYRCHPQIARLVSLLQEGAIGEVRVIQATFAFSLSAGTEHRLRDHALAGGSILDIGGYPTSMARLIAGATTGIPFANPTEVKATGKIGEKSRVDEWTVAALGFESGIVAQLMTGIAVRGDNVVRVYGSEGELLIPAPWTLRGSSRTTEIIVHRHDDEPRIFTVEAPADPWTIEADTVAAHLNDRQAPAMTWDDSLGNMQTLDRWREQIGLVYDQEKLTAKRAPVHGRPLARRDDATMRYGTIAGVSKPVSRLVMGVDNQRTMPHAAVMFDDFFERGGTCFDTAWQYAGGACETILGRWIEQRGVRDEVVILDKGAHTPFCTPADAESQLDQSLERLRTDHVDLYMLHRDNLQVPAGEFIDVLNRMQQDGKLRVFGASNWTIERVEEANQWAAEHGLNGFTMISNNFSLARMVEPPWAGCRSASDPVTRAWLERTHMPIFPWSSQARGFFTGRARPDDFSDAELVRCWYSEDNFQRLERVNQMARERGVPPIAIALAWVLNQPFPTFPLIGPRALSETRTSFQALDIDLTPREVAWLNLEGER
ncbi:MAG TPA: aldo/keto reductase [Thermomicrobiales bacterium]|nr:aldo/keto reductase [Thermomicrobiales bacterium]